jgi:hypothetical protein
MTNLKIQNIDIKKTTLPFRTAVEFKRLVNDYLTILDEDSQAILGRSKGNSQVELAIKRQTLDAKFKDIQKITDIKLRERKMSELQPQIDELDKETNDIESKLYTDPDYRIQLLQSTQKFENESNKVMIDNQIKYYEKEIEILKLILPKIADIPKDFDYELCSALEPTLVIQEVLKNKENDCNVFFTKWSKIKSQITQ